MRETPPPDAPNELTPQRPRVASVGARRRRQLVARLPPPSSRRRQSLRRRGRRRTRIGVEQSSKHPVHEPLRGGAGLAVEAGAVEPETTALHILDDVVVA